MPEIVRNQPVSSVDIAVLLLIYAFLLTCIPPWLLTLETIPTGGDTASHYYTAWFMKNHLIPSGTLTGWSMGNLGGFPMLQNYFPLPFLIMTGLSFLMPLEVAFKIVSISGIFLLPLCTFLFFRNLNQQPPVPAAGAIATVPFLFMEGNTMWGANIPSTLAGPFCYSIGFSLTVLWLGWMYRAFTQNRGFIRCTLLLTLIGFCHGYTLLFAGFSSLFFILSQERFAHNLKQLILIHSIGIGLMAFWLLPLILFLPVTTKFGFVWNFPTLSQFASEVVPPLTRPFILLTLLVLSTKVLAYLKPKPETARTPERYLIYLIMCGLVLYAAGYRLKLVDVRFLPFFQFFLITGGVIGLSRIAVKPGARVAFIVTVLIATILWTDRHETMIRSWSTHNYAGFQSAPWWKHVDAVTRFLKGTVSDPRVVYEHSPRYDKTGSIRVFESLPLFSGRSTLEGVYIQGSLNVPFIFYLQAEVSQTPSMPLSEYVYPAFNLDRAVRHLRLFNVNHCIFSDPKTIAAAGNHPDYLPVFKSGPFTVFELTGTNNRYAVPLTYKPAMISTSEFRQPFYQWFRTGNTDVPIARVLSPGNRDTERFIPVSPSDIANLPATPLAACSLPASETLSETTISLKGVTPGHPLLIKVSWHPNWRVQGADTIYLASPAFMLIFPESEEVTLTYANGWPEYTGMGLSILTLFLVFTPIGRPVSAIIAPVTRIIDSHPRALYRTLVPGAAILFGGILFLATPQYPVSGYWEGLAHYTRNHYNEARADFRDIIDNHPTSIVSDEARFHYAMSFYLERTWDKAYDMFFQLVRLYPDSRRVPEALYHLGLCSMSMDQNKQAASFYHRLIREYPGSPWATHATKRLSELPAYDKT